MLRNFSPRIVVLTYEPELNDDARLIDATLAGDPAAFGRLVTRYQDRLYNTLLRLVGSPEDARDLAQDAFLQVDYGFRGADATLGPPWILVHLG